MSDLRPIPDEILEQTAALLNLNYRPEVGEIGRSLVYGDVQDRALVTLYIEHRGFTLVASSPNLPHQQPQRYLKGFHHPRLNAALEALGGQPYHTDSCTLTDSQLYLSCDEQRIGRSLQAQSLANLILVASEIVNESGVPLVPICQNCRLRPGKLRLLPDPRYCLERLCSRCLPQPDLPKRGTEPAATLSLSQEAEFLHRVLAESPDLSRVNPSGVRLWKQCPQPYAMVIFRGGEMRSALDLPIPRLQEMPIEDLALLAAWDLDEQMLVAERQKARIARRWKSECPSGNLWEVSEPPTQQALAQAISRHGKERVARLVFTRLVLERLDLVAPDRQTKLDVPDSRWEMAWQQAESRLRDLDLGLETATLPAYPEVRQTIQDCLAYTVDHDRRDAELPRPDSEDELQILWKPYRGQFEARAMQQPDQPDAHYLLALFDLQLEQRNQAYQSCKKVLSLQPDHPGARSLESWLESRLEKPLPADYLPRVEEAAWLLGPPLPADLNCLDLANEAYESYYAARFPAAGARPDGRRILEILASCKIPGNAAINPPQGECHPDWDELAELCKVFQPTRLQLGQLLTLYAAVGAWPQVWGIAQTLRELAFPSALAPAPWLAEMIERASNLCDGPDLSHEQLARVHLLMIPGIHNCLQGLYASLSRGPLPATLPALENWLERLASKAPDNNVLDAALAVGHCLKPPVTRKQDTLMRLRTWVLKLAQMVGPPPVSQAAER